MAENEVKFVARYDRDFREFAIRQFGYTDISQGYLNANARLRRARGIHVGGLRYYFTYKQRLPNGENFEIEPEISREQFNEAWPHTEHRLEKVRVSIPHDSIHWDIDFYEWSYPYFILIEAEMPSGMLRPATIPEIIASRIVHEVARADDRFTARLLSDEDHAMRLAVELGLLYL